MHQLDGLAERLLREGVAYRHVRRYVGELRDHSEDAVRAEEARGAGTAEARAAATARLGSIDDLAGGMIARPEFQGLGGRFPRLWNGGGPVVIWLGSGIAALIVATGIAWILTRLGILPEGGSPLLAPLQKPADLFLFLLVRVFPVIVGGLMVVGAVRQRSAMLWPLIGTALLAAIASISDAGASLPLSPDVKGELRFGLGFASKDLPQVLLRMAGMFALMLAPLLFRKRLTQPPV